VPPYADAPHRQLSVTLSCTVPPYAVAPHRQLSVTLSCTVPPYADAPHRQLSVTLSCTVPPYADAPHRQLSVTLSPKWASAKRRRNRKANVSDVLAVRFSTISFLLITKSLEEGGSGLSAKSPCVISGLKVAPQWRHSSYLQLSQTLRHNTAAACSCARRHTEWRHSLYLQNRPRIWMHTKWRLCFSLKMDSIS
jgi:hypothetical protein